MPFAHQLWLNPSAQILLVASFVGHHPYWIRVSAYAESIESYWLGGRKQFLGQVVDRLVFQGDRLWMSIFELLVVMQLFPYQRFDMFSYLSYSDSVTLKIGMRRLGDGFVSDASWPQGSMEAFRNHSSIPLPPFDCFRHSWTVNSPRLPFLHISADVGDRADYMWTTIRTILGRVDSKTSVQEEFVAFMDLWFHGYNLPDPIRHLILGRPSAPTGLPSWTTRDDQHYRPY